jgi:hypothetical protein
MAEILFFSPLRGGEKSIFPSLENERIQLAVKAIIPLTCTGRVRNIAKDEDTDVNKLVENSMCKVKYKYVEVC